MHVIEIIRAYAQVPKGDKVVAWKKASLLLSWYAGGRSSEVALSSWDFSSWDDEFSAFVISWFETKLYSDNKTVVLTAGSSQYLCPLLLLGDCFAMGLYVGCDMTATGATSYIFQSLANNKDPASTMTDIVKSVLVGSASKAMMPYVAKQVPPLVRADGLRPGVAGTLTARMPRELALAVTGHAGGEGRSHFDGYTETVTNSVVHRLPGAQVLAGWPAPPWGQMTRGPRPASLDELVHTRVVSAETLEKLADKYFNFVSGYTLPSLLVEGALRKFVHAALASAIMWYPERVKLNEDASLILRLRQAYNEVCPSSGSDAHATIQAHAGCLRRKFELDNLHIASAPVGSLGATRTPGVSAASSDIPVGALLSAVQTLGGRVASLAAIVASMDQRLKGSSADALGESVPPKSLPDFTAAPDDAMSAAGPLSALETISSASVPSALPAKGPFGLMYSPEFSIKLSDCNFVANVTNAFSGKLNEARLSKQENSELGYIKSIVLALTRGDERKTLTINHLDEKFNEGVACKLVGRLTGFVIARLEILLDRSLEKQSVNVFRCSTVNNLLKGQPNTKSLQAAMSRAPTAEEFNQIEKKAARFAIATTPASLPACVESKRDWGKRARPETTGSGVGGESANMGAGASPSAGAGAGACAGDGAGTSASEAFDWHNPVHALAMCLGTKRM